LWIIAEQFAAAACVATTYGGALLSIFRAMDLGPPLNSVLESKLNHDLLQQGCCQAGEASGCLVELPARLGLRLGFRVRISELAASAKSYPHSLNSFLLEKADLICHFWQLDPLSVGDFSPAR
jgi:hypothetical protein